MYPPTPLQWRRLLGLTSHRRCDVERGERVRRQERERGGERGRHGTGGKSGEKGADDAYS